MASQAAPVSTMTTNELPRNPTPETAQNSTFEGLWGSSTQYKSGIRRRRRLDIDHPNSDLPMSTALHTNAMPLRQDAPFNSRPTPARTISSRTRRPPPDFNKPLPPLPYQTQVVDEETTAEDGTLRRRSTVSRSILSQVSMSSAYHGAMRMATFGLASKKKRGEVLAYEYGAGRKDSTSEKRQEFVPVLNRSPDAPPIPSKSHKREQQAAQPVSQVSTPFPGLYVDQGTQVDPPSLDSLGPTKGSPGLLKGFTIRPSGKRFHSSESHVSPMAMAKPNANSDYFHFQAEDIRGQVAALTSRRQSAYGSTFDSSSSSGTRSPSQDSSGTCGSSYSVEEQRPEIRGRSSHTRTASESTLTVRRSPETNSGETGADDALHTTHAEPKPRPSVSLDAIRPRIQSFQRYPRANSKAPHGRRHRSDHNASPLRQELSAHTEEVEPLPVTPDAAEMFRVPVEHVNPSEQPTFTIVDVPEHLAGSPLCPLHPKHKSRGMGACPYHGRPILDESEDFQDSEIKDDKPDEKVVASVDQAAFDLIVPQHSPDSAECPANPKNSSGGKGVCIIHGRSHDPDPPPKRVYQGPRDFMWT